MINVLHVVSGLGSGGVESMLYSYYQKMDRTKVHFDFLVHGSVDGMFACKFREMGCSIYLLTQRKDSVFKNFRDMVKGISQKKYDVIHSHIGVKSFIPLSIAYFKGIKARIAGAHCAVNLDISKKCMLLLTRFFANNYAACSGLSARITFNKKDGDYFLLKNGVDVQRFLFNEENRIAIRKQYNIDDSCILLGNVGRLVWEKNQKFLIDLLAKLNNESSQSYKLMLVGAGSLKETLLEQARERNVTDQVIFVEPQKDVEKYYSAFDVFMFPSTNEGFGIVAIEAQINGLEVLASNILPHELKISSKCRFLNLNNISEWCNCLKNINFTCNMENRRIQSIKKDCYDITMLADSLTSFYENIV